MKHSLSLLLSFGFGATLVACGDDGVTETPVVPDGGTSSSASSTAPRPSGSTSSTAPRPSGSTSSTAPRPSGTAADSDAGPTGDGGTETDGATSSDGGLTVPDASVPGFEISSTSFDDGALLPEQFTCQDKPFGDGYSPQLAWTGAPHGTLSYALVFVDTSLIEVAPQYAFHYAAWNIPSAITELDEHLGKGQFPTELKSGSQQGEQYRAGPPHDLEFFGPCPSWQTLCSGAERITDTYEFVLFSFDSAEQAPPAPVEGENYGIALYEYFDTHAKAKTVLNAQSNAVPSSFDCPPPPETGDAGADASTDGSVDPIVDSGAAADAGDASADASDGN